MLTLSDVEIYIVRVDLEKMTETFVTGHSPTVCVPRAMCHLLAEGYASMPHPSLAHTPRHLCFIFIQSVSSSASSATSVLARGSLPCCPEQGLFNKAVVQDSWPGPYNTHMHTVLNKWDGAGSSTEVGPPLQWPCLLIQKA